MQMVGDLSLPANGRTASIAACAMAVTSTVVKGSDSSVPIRCGQVEQIVDEFVHAIDTAHAPREHLFVRRQIVAQRAGDAGSGSDIRPPR